MLGKSAGPGGYALWLLVVGVVTITSGCPHNIAQDKATSGDGKPKGAKPMVLENGEAKATGIVTYPGGDRVDWKVIDLPEKKRGTLDVRLTWNPPRPGLQLAFDVFDEWNTPLASSKKTSKKRSQGRSRSASLQGARGKYFIRVYAVGRGDAGKYKLTVEFKEAVAGLTFDPLKLEISDPPKLAAVPDVEVGCDEFSFDIKVPACKLVCPSAGAPPNWPACKGKCPTPPTVDEPSCWATMPCPKGAPDERIRACKPTDWGPCPDKKNPDMNNPNCRIKADPIVGRIIGKEIQGQDLIIRIGVGTDQGVGKGWRGTVIKGGDITAAAVPGGELVIVRIDKALVIAKIKLTADQIAASPFVRLSPP